MVGEFGEQMICFTILESSILQLVTICKAFLLNIFTKDMILYITQALVFWALISFQSRDKQPFI